MSKEVPTIEWRLTKEDLDHIRDDKEKSTGIFHWQTKDGGYIPVTDMSDEQLEHAKEVCEKRLNDLNAQLTKMENNLNYLVSQLKGWAYREEKIDEVLYARRDGVSKEAAEGTKEIVD